MDEDMRCDKCIHSAEHEFNKGNVTQIIGQQTVPDKIYICHRFPPQVNFIPVNGALQNQITMQPVSTFPVLKGDEYCGEFEPFNDEGEETTG